MRNDGDLARLAAADPMPPERLAREAAAPWVAALRAAIAAEDAPARRPRLRLAGRLLSPVLTAIAFLAIGAVLALLLVAEGSDRRPAPATPAPAPVAPGIRGAPNTPEGRHRVVALLEDFAAHVPSSRKGHENFEPLPSTAHVVFSVTTRYGEYTIWRARTVGRRGAATAYASPRFGIVLAVGPENPLPKPPYVLATSAGGLPAAKVREIWGRASPSVARVVVVLKGGGRAPAILRGGWWVFTQDVRHPKPVAVLGLDGGGRVVARDRRRPF
jgi:hypothetical protein